MPSPCPAVDSILQLPWPSDETINRTNQRIITHARAMTKPINADGNLYNKLGIRTGRSTPLAERP